MATNSSSQEDVEIALQTRINNIKYEKNIELNNQLVQLNQQYHQLQEKQDIDTIDRIVNDTEKKYQLMNDTIRQSAVQYAKSVTSVPIIKDANGNEQFNKEYKNLPSDVKSKFANEISINNLSKQQEESNEF